MSRKPGEYPEIGLESKGEAMKFPPFPEELTARLENVERLVVDMQERVGRLEELLDERKAYIAP